jgi:chromate transporter
MTQGASPEAVGSAQQAQADSGAPLVPCSQRDFVGYFLRLGTFNFGGPIAFAGYMQRDLVEARRWISKQHYLEGLALAQLAAGPLAGQLAIYLGWLRAGMVGATLVGIAFVIPSFLMVLALAWLYLRYDAGPPEASAAVLSSRSKRAFDVRDRN